MEFNISDIYPSDVKTLPYFDMMTLARIKPFGSDGGLWDWFMRQLKHEFRYGWQSLRPQFLKIYRSKSKINPVTGEHMIVKKYKPAKTIKRIPIMKLEQDFNPCFRWWYYDEKTDEAMMVLDRNDD